MAVYERQFEMPQSLANPVQASPRSYAALRVRPLSGALGAEITGIDLTRLDDAMFAEIKQALMDHQVLIFPDQDIGPEHQVALAERLGPLKSFPFSKSLDGQPFVTEIRFEAGDKFNFGAGWHSDSMNFERPPAYTMTHCKVAPRAGGDTSFANLYLAWETLSEGLRTMLRPLKGMAATSMMYGSAAQSTTSDWFKNTTTTAQIQPGQDTEEFAHPIARTHPETGRIALYTSCQYTARFEGMTQAESLPLLRYLWEHATRPEFTCRTTPRAGSLTLWDNRCCLHYAHNDHPGERRVLHRVIVEGERPS